MKKNKKDVLVITIMVLVLIIGITYAYFKIVKETSFKMSIYDLDITFNDGDLINSKKLYPIDESKIPTEGIKKEFTMAKKKETDKDVYTKISLVDIELDSDARDKDLRWRLLKNDVLLTEGSFVNLRDNNKLDLAPNIKLTTTKLDTYTLYIWIQETNYPQRESLMNKSIKARIEVEGMLSEYDGIPNEGKLVDGMIPVVYDEASDKWIKAGGSLGWYDYDNQMWANAVTVYPDHRNEYMESEIGTEVKMEDISTMWVWIPRYKYRIPSSMGRGTTTPPEIDVVFENGTEATGVDEQTYETGIKSDGTNENYYTHPSFRNGTVVKNKEPYDIGGWDHELTGIWVAKFEAGIGDENSECYTSPSLDNCIDVIPVIKPNVKVLTYQDIPTEISTSVKIANGTYDSETDDIQFTQDANNIYGFNTRNNNISTHIVKSTDWGAVSYISQSKYGKMGNNNYDQNNKEVYINNSTKIYTGRSSGSVPGNGSSSLTGGYSYNDYTCETTDTNQCIGIKEKYKGTGASTTGTIYGIYDMVGGAEDLVMSKIQAKNPKFFDSYPSETVSKENTILGDARWETRGWYSDYSLGSLSDPVRGGPRHDGSNAGLFRFGVEHSSSIRSFHVVLIP